MIPLPFTSASSKRNRAGWDLVLLALAVGMTSYAVWSLRHLWVLWPWLLLAGAGLLGGYALVRMERWTPDAQPLGVPAHFPEWRRRGLGLLFGLASLILTGWVVATLWPNYRITWQEVFAPWAVAVALMVVAGWLLGALGQGEIQALGRAKKKIATNPLSPTWEMILFLLILALAMAVRLYRLGEIPPAIFVDETAGATNAIRLLEGRAESPFGTGWYETPNAFIYYMAGLFRLFGANYFSLKAVSLIPSILTVPAVYLLARALFGQTTGLLAMFLLAVNRWHMTMSRWAWNETGPPLFFALGAFFLVRGLRERRALDYALGGILGGMTIYTYLSSRLAVLTLVLFALGWILLDPDGPVQGWRRYNRGLIFYGLAALVVVSPILVTYATDPFTFMNRTNEITVFKEVETSGNWEPLKTNLWNHAQLFFQEGDPNGRHNLPGEPQTDPVSGVLLTLGVGYALLRLRDRRRLLMLLWLVISLAGGYLSESRIGSPNSYRTLTTVVIVVIIAADVLDRSARGAWLLTRGEPGSARWRTGLGVVAAAGILSLALVAGAWDVNTYFGRQASAEGVQISFNQTETRVAEEVLAALEQGKEVYLSPRFANSGPVQFYVWGAVQAREGNARLSDMPFHLIQPEVDLPLPGRENGALVLVDNYYWPLVDYFRLYYPNASTELVDGPGGVHLYMRMDVSAADIAVIQGLQSTLTLGDGSATTRTVPGLNQNWDEREDVAQVQWAGSLRIHRAGPYDFVPPPGLALTLDDLPWTGPRYLPTGLHSFEATLINPASQTASSQLIWRRPDPSSGQVQEAVPPSAFFQIPPPQQGLLATYYAGESWAGPSLFQQVTPFLLLAWSPEGPFAGAFSVRFTGSLRLDSPGPVRFRLDADDGVRFIVDGQIVAEALTPDQPNQVIVSLDLAQGEHAIQIDYFQRGGGNALEFYWQRPGLPESPVPPSVLSPGEPGR